MPRKDRLAICGPIGSGKTSISYAWAELVGASVFNFSDEIKEELAFALAINDIRTYQSLDPWTMLSENLGVGVEKYRSIFYDPVRKNEYRGLMQYWATEFRRSQDPDYWVNICMNKMDKLSGPFVVQDFRYPNEYDALREREFTIIRLAPNSRAPDIGDLRNHDSEQYWPTFEVDIELDFMYGIEKQVHRLISEHGLNGNASG